MQNGVYPASFRISTAHSMKRLILSLNVLLTCLSIAADNHFLSDPTYRTKVEKAFRQKINLVGSRFFNLSGQQATPKEREALEFLYAYMPLADATDYPTTYYLDNVRASFRTQQEMPWGQKVPELLFRHFVLPIRVNNENLDNSRSEFYQALKDRVKGLSMYDAILEVNHWCHEHVTYQPSDARTSSPLASMRTATGRCGEESTFAVAALRAIGIPARQVYTPRWAHTDDNHAWVEAWADGRWYFLGACEPEAVLNLGWFNAPASRAMLMHTRAFGDYNGPEEVMLRTSNFTEINLIGNYAATARTDFTVVDHVGKPISQARVDFKIYNYAEFFTVVTKYTDTKGRTFLTSGLGDMLVWASKDGWYGFSKASFGKDKQITIRLDRCAATDNRRQRYPAQVFDIVPPVEKVMLPDVPEDKRRANLRRFAYEDSVRTAYTSTFYNKETARKAALENGLPADSIIAFLVKARGNHAVILSFLVRHKDRSARAFSLLRSLSDKDLRDIPTEILEDNFNASSDEVCPRVEDEMIIAPFKQQLEKAFDKQTANRFRANPAQLVKWVKANLRLYPDPKALRIAQTPIGVWHARLTDTRSRDIFFVDVARSLGIPARKDVVTSKVQYRENGHWIDVNFDAVQQQAAPTGTLTLTYQPTKYLDDPKYYRHFTISKIENGTTSLLNFYDGTSDESNGTQWSNTFKNGARLDVGTYLLTTGTRLANGSVLANTQIFTIRPGKTTTLPLDVRTNTDEVSVIGSFDSESKFSKDSKDVSILSQTGRGYFVVGILGVGQEPTNHALRDIANVKSSLNKWGRPLVLLFENEADAAKFNAKDFGELPANTIFGIDRDGSIKRQITAQMKLQTDRLLPIFIIADTFNRIVFVSQGYTIGLGEQLQKVINKL